MSILVLDKIDLVFFLVVYVELCNNVENTLNFQLLLSTKPWNFHLYCSAKEDLGVHRELEGNRTTTANQNQLKGYSMPYCLPTWGSWLLAVGCHWSRTDWALASGEQLHCASLVLYILVSLLFSYHFSLLLNCFYHNSQVLTFFQFSHPVAWGLVSKWLCSASLPAVLHHNTGITTKYKTMIYLCIH